MLLTWQSAQARVAWTPARGKVEWEKTPCVQRVSVFLWQESQVVGKPAAACAGLLVAV